MPARVAASESLGVPLVIGRREGYRLWDVNGHELLDVHLNGGTYNLGHRNPTLVEVLTEFSTASTSAIITSHRKREASWPRSWLRSRRAICTTRCLFLRAANQQPGPSGCAARHRAAQDRCAGGRPSWPHRAECRRRTRRHGAFLPRRLPRRVPESFLQRSRGDGTGACRQRRRRGLIGTVPATYGFAVPSDDYLPGVKSLCERFGTIYIADEVQTGLGHTGHLWELKPGISSPTF